MGIKQPVRLDIWKGDWGLPSIDLDCIRFMTYIKISGLEFEATSTNNPFWTPNGSLPVVHFSKKDVTNYDDLVSYLQSHNYCPDHGLSKKQIAETEAYTNMLKEKLYPALQFIWWVDEKNVNSVTKPWYSKAIPFPFSFYYPSKYVKNAQEMVKILYEKMEEQHDIQTKIYSEAEKCLTTISIRLGDSEFMFGSHPTSIDATLFSYLAPLLKAPFKSTVLQNHLKCCTNLHKYVSRINQRYFSKDYHEYESKKKEELKSQQNRDSDFPNKTRNQLFATLFAFIAMISYAVSAGIVQRSQVDTKEFLEEINYEPADKFKEEN